MERDIGKRARDRVSYRESRKGEREREGCWIERDRVRDREREKSEREICCIVIQELHLG